MASRKGDPPPSLFDRGLHLRRGESVAPLFRLLGRVLRTPLRPLEVRILPAPAVGADERFRADERAWVLDDGADSRIELARRNGYGEKFGDAGIARFNHPFRLRVGGQHDDGNKGIGAVGVRTQQTHEFKPVHG